MTKLKELLSGNSYPGRGIIVGMTPDGKNAVCAYFIMGRSANSRNRVFVGDGDGLRTKAFDETKVEDPSLIIYHPVRVLDKKTVVTNGDQTDTVFDGLREGLTFEQSLVSREFEPDAPNFTPRISGLIDVTGGSASFCLSVLKSFDGEGKICERCTYQYDAIPDGRGLFIHTYIGDGSPLPSFAGEPEAVETCDAIDEFTKTVWDSLDEDNKVSLFVRYIDVKRGVFSSRIVNKNK